MIIMHLPKLLWYMEELKERKYVQKNIKEEHLLKVEDPKVRENIDIFNVDVQKNVMVRKNREEHLRINLKENLFLVVDVDVQE